MPRLLSFKVALLLLVLMVLDMSVFPILSMGAFRPVLSYLFVLYVAFEWHWKKTLMAAFLVGCIRDALSFHPFGIEIVSLSIVSMGLVFFVQKMVIQSTLVRMLGAFIFTFLSLTFVIGFNSLLNAQLKFADQGFSTVIASSFLTTLCMPIFFWGADRLFRRSNYSYSSYSR